MTVELLRIDRNPHAHPAERTRPDEKMRVTTIVRDSPTVQERYPAIDRRNRCFRERGCSRHEVHVRHTASAPDGHVKQRGRDTACEHAALECASDTRGMMRRIENRLVEDGLYGESCGRKNELPAWLQIGVDSRVDGRSPFIQAKGRTTTNDIRREDVSALVRKNAGREAAGEQLPPVTASGVLEDGRVARALGCQRTRDHGAEEQGDHGDDPAAAPPNARLKMADAPWTQ